MLENDKNYWVALGASAGGLEALKEFLLHFKAAQNCYIIIAQHLDPKHPTILQELLARSTDLKVHLLMEDTKPAIGEVYIISPGHNATVHDGVLKLSPAAAIGPKPSIDIFLDSLAEDVQDKSIAVIMSGTGSDGAQGVMAVKAVNGVVFVQDRQTAKYLGMPDSAIETGAVDLVLPIKDIAHKIEEFIQSSDNTLKVITQTEKKGALNRIFQRIFDQTGYDFSGYKLKTINRRIARRMAVHHVTTMDEYVELLESDSQEAENLFKDFLISVTAFFRDRDAFEDLAKTVDTLVVRTATSGAIRVWVPGCANGEEAYSIAILLHLSLVKHRKSIPYQVFATDIDEKALNQARKGYYSPAQVNGIDLKILETFFTPKEGHFLISKIIRDKVVFAKQNVITDPPFSKLDLISCRNLLIYFSSELQKRVLQIFHFSLRPHGFLFLGRSESTQSSTPELFETYIKKSQIFMRKNIDLSRRMDKIQSANNYAKMTQRHSSAIIQSEKFSISNRVEQVLLQEMMPATVVVDGDGQVLHIRGDIGQYLQFPQGKIDTNILSLAKDDIKVDIRALLSKARQDGNATAQSLFFSGSHKELLFINVRSLIVNPDDEQLLFMIAFLPANVDDTFYLNLENVDDDKRQANEFLVNEVALFKERLQTSVEELETTNEELQSTNEELQSANEELQSTNEELQTANEELQSTNEELSTVNQELEVKGFELEQLNSDLESILSTMNELVIVLDMRLRVVRFTKIAARTFKLNRDMVNQTITTIGLDLDIPNFRDQLLDVAENRVEKQIKTRYKSVVYSIRLVPYESEIGKVSGILMFLENSEIIARNKTSENELVHTLELLGKHITNPMLCIDDTGTILYANEQTLSNFGYHSDNFITHKINEFVPEPYHNQLDILMAHYFTGDNALFNIWREFNITNIAGERSLQRILINENWLNGEKHYICQLDTTPPHK